MASVQIRGLQTCYGAWATVIRKCRPDWHITTEEMNAAWQQNQKELFSPYGKTFAELIAEEG